MEVTLDDWVMCTRCRTLIYERRFLRSAHVCHECGWHAQLTADERLAQLMDSESIRPLDLWVPDQDPLNFVDLKPYSERLREAREMTGMEEAVLCARGAIDGNPVIAAVMDFRFLGGSLSGAVGELITQAAETALARRTPLLIVSASGGARMQEGAISLMQLAKTSQALGELDEAGILTVSVITDPTFGGVAASYATLCDVILAEPGARFGFAGARVIEQTIGQKLPAGFQTAEFLLDHGLVDAVRPRHELRRALARVLSIASRRGQPAAGVPDTDELVRDPSLLPERKAWDVVRRARDLARPTALDYIHRMLTDFEELRGDRLGSDSPSIVGGVGRLEGQPVMVIGTQKGHTTEELTSRNFGMPLPGGYRKAARLMRMAAKLGLPVITLVDTPGAYPGVEAEEQGQPVAIAENLRLMARLPVPVISVVTGEGGSGGALALAVADQVLICENAVYSVISAEGCAAILWKDSARAPEAAAALRVDPRELLRLRVVDGVIAEPPGGMESDHQEAAARLGAALGSVLRSLSAKDPAQLIRERRARFRGFGATVTTEPAYVVREGG